jgi:hypothetical protein
VVVHEVRRLRAAARPEGEAVKEILAAAGLFLLGLAIGLIKPWKD